MTELVECDGEHLERVQNPAYVWDVPQQRDDHHVCDYDAKGRFLCWVHTEGAGLERRMVEACCERVGRNNCHDVEEGGNCSKGNMVEDFVIYDKYI